MLIDDIVYECFLVHYVVFDNIIQMGNQLCPANNKEIIENFKGIQKGDKSMSDLVSYLQEKGKKDDSGYLGV